MSADDAVVPVGVPARLRRPYTGPVDRNVTDAEADAAQLRSRVGAVSRGVVRASVLGVSDGLVTNICLILAVAGADSSATAVRIAGLASLIAGAFSMAVGEWVSVRSQVEQYEGILAEMRTLLRRNPRLVLGELTDRLVDAGFAEDTAQRASTELPLDEQKFFDFTASTVFGVNPRQLGSPYTAAISSFVLFSAGALVPLLPWLFTSGGTAIAISAAATAIASVVVGGWVSHSAGRSAIRGATRQLLIVVAAASVTYGIGTLFGTTVS